MVKVLGYLWRLGLIALLGSGVYWLMFRRHLGSKEFAARVADVAKTYMGAESTQMEPLAWSGNTATARIFAAKGGERSHFKMLGAGDVSFRVPLSMYWQSEWRLNRISAGVLQVEFRSDLQQGISVPPGEASTPALPGTQTIPAVPDASAAEGESDLLFSPELSPPEERVRLELDAPDASLAPPQKEGNSRAIDLDLHRDGFSVSPKFNSLRIDGIDAARFDAGWGAIESTRGELREASLKARRSADGSWSIDVPSGTLHQNWLRDMKLTGLKARLRGGDLTIEDTPLQIGDTTATLSGSIRGGGEVPAFDLTIQGENLALDDFCGEPFSDMLDLRANGTLRLTGSPNIVAGVKVSGAMQVTEGSVRGLPIQLALANATTRIRFREFTITGGTIDFSTSGGRLYVQSFYLASRADVILRGRFECDRSSIVGEFEIGVDPVLLQKLAPEVQEKFFGREERGKRWMLIPINTPFEKLTSAAAREFTAAHEATKKPR